MENRKSINNQDLTKHTPYLNIIHDLATVLLSINPDSDWYAGWTVEEEGIYRLYNIDASKNLQSEMEHFPPDHYLEFIFLCDIYPSSRKCPDDSPRRVILDMASPIWKAIDKTLHNITENLDRQETVEFFLDERGGFFVYRQREGCKTTQAEWSLSLENLPASPQLKSLTRIFLDLLDRNGIISKNKLIVCEYQDRATFQFLVIRNWDKNTIGTIHSFLMLAKYTLRTAQGQGLTTQDILTLLNEAGCLDGPLYCYDTNVLVQSIGVLSNANKKGRIYKLGLYPRKIDESRDDTFDELFEGFAESPYKDEVDEELNRVVEVEFLIEGSIYKYLVEATGRDLVKSIDTHIWIEKKSDELPTKEEVIEALKAEGFLQEIEPSKYMLSLPDRLWGPAFFNRVRSEDYSLIKSYEVDVQFIPLVRYKVYTLNCSYLEAIEVLTKGLKIFRCLWCGRPVEKNKGYDPAGIYCSRNCYNRFIERLKKKGQIRSGERSRGRGKKHPKVKSYEEVYMSLREELGSRAYRKFWEKYEPYIGKEPRPYKRTKTF